MFTDSKILFNANNGNRYTEERKRMVDIAAVREAYNAGILTNAALKKKEI